MLSTADVAHTTPWCCSPTCALHRHFRAARAACVVPLLNDFLTADGDHLPHEGTVFHMAVLPDLGFGVPLNSRQCGRAVCAARRSRQLRRSRALLEGALRKKNLSKRAGRAARAVCDARLKSLQLWLNRDDVFTRCRSTWACLRARPLLHILCFFHHLGVARRVCVVVAASHCDSVGDETLRGELRDRLLSLSAQVRVTAAATAAAGSQGQARGRGLAERRAHRQGAAGVVSVAPYASCRHSAVRRPRCCGAAARIDPRAR